ncbi:MAG: response regulator [Hyphomicrobiales bacterium]|nr:response regulator [Hyphomicrobiales bacterium]
MSEAGPLSERAIVLAPKGRDAQIAASILKEAGVPADARADLATVIEELGKGAGLAIIADEALRDADLRPLADFLSRQPPWSDIPIILLTYRGGGPERNPTATRLAEMLGNVTFLERPFHPTTLASLARAALRGRRRQYEARARLEELIESEQRLQNALEAGELGSWTLNIDGMVLDASESCRAHFDRRGKEEFSFEELLGSVHREDVARVQAALAQTLRTGCNCAVEYRNVWPDGTVHWIDMRARMVKDGPGKIGRLVGVSSDITARKTAELEREQLFRELKAERLALSELTRTLEERVAKRTGELLAEVAAREKAQEQLLQSQKMEVVGQLTGGVAHDFNNLLMAITGNLELLHKKLPNDARIRRLLDGAMQGARRGVSLTQRMLAFSRQQELKTSSADMATLLVGIRELLERTLGPHISLIIEAPSNLPPAQVDANQIELAILNLAINARDAMPGGGEIRISVAKREDGAGVGLDDKPYLRVEVADTGSGMDAATLKKAIEPFFSTKPPGKGTGLGLSTVHGLAVQLGGKLELSSTVGKGTTATLWLPIATTRTSVPRPHISEIREGRKGTILVVEDDPLIAMSTADMLEDLGHTVVEANSAKRALEILETGRSIDMMMTDQAMPGMTGVELVKLVRRKHPTMPVLLVSGYADLPAAQKALLPRLSKPYQQSQLKAEIDRLLESKP